MLNIRATKKTVPHTVMLQQMYSLNYVWLMYESYIQQKAPELYGNAQYYQLFEEYGLDEARRLIRALGLRREEVNDLAEYLEYSHWAIFENIEVVEMTASSFRMRALDCSAQRAAKKWGMQYYDCSSGGLKIRAGFFRGINARAKVQRIFTPTEAEPEGDRAAASCEWLVSLD